MSDFETAPGEARDWWRAVRRGWFGSCPVCGTKTLFVSFLKMATQCIVCKTNLESYRTDDIPAYFVIFIVGHIIVPVILLAEKLYQPPLWLHGALWLPLCLALSLWLLPRVKGSAIGLLWALRAGAHTTCE